VAIPKVDLAAAAVGQIRDAVLSGAIAAGDELPSERELALELGINRTTVREVLTRLELLGLIDRQHGKRCRVLDYRRNGSLELIPHLVRLGIRGIGRSIREATAISYEGTAALAARRRSTRRYFRRRQYQRREATRPKIEKSLFPGAVVPILPTTSPA